MHGRTYLRKTELLVLRIYFIICFAEALPQSAFEDVLHAFYPPNS